jgi:hypothetical protein
MGDNFHKDNLPPAFCIFGNIDNGIGFNRNIAKGVKAIRIGEGGMGIPFCINDSNCSSGDGGIAGDILDRRWYRR